MGKIVEITVSKGRTCRPSDLEQWLREEYTLKATVEDEAELEIARGHMDELITGWLTASAAKPTAQMPGLDPDELAKLSWRAYKTKEPCKPEEVGWVFRNTHGVEALADLIEKHGNDVPVQIGPHKFTVRFSGKEKQFIGRAPIKSQA
jgi:hypothetical protein